MPKPLLRCVTSGRGSFSQGSPKKENDADRNHKNGVIENGYAPETFSPGPIRNRHKSIVSLLRCSSIVIVVLALTGSFWWTLSLTSVSIRKPFRGYRQLQEQLVSELYEIGDLSLALSKSRELEFCPEEFENHVSCFNISENLALGFSDGKEYSRHCEHITKQNCLLLPPANYRIPLRWPTGKDVIWLANVKITAQEVLSSGSLTKRMMMLDEDQVSFRSMSNTFGVEDYSHQIAEIIGLRNVSHFAHTGVRTILDIECGYGSFGAHLYSHQLLTMCLANYEASGSQVQLTLERGLPAMIGSFTTKQLPYPSLSFDIIHCARCHVEWEKKMEYI